MARRPRCDSPGTLHHVANRAIARRTLFETDADFRFFLSRLARCAHRGDLEVRAYCLMTTHYHLFVRSPLGRLDQAMHEVQTDYARRFNRIRRRDGPLFRGRYWSRPVDTGDYARALVAYVDANPVQARLCGRAEQYPYGSARHYAQAAGPRWLDRQWVEDTVRAAAREPAYRPEAYPSAFPVKVASVRLERAAGGASGWDAATAGELSWMAYKARIADGTTPGVATESVTALEARVAVRRERDGARQVRVTRKPWNAWELIRVGLLREQARLAFEEIAARVGTSPRVASNQYGRHRRALAADPRYRGLYESLGRG